jgi:hypothetical protein
MRLPRDLEIERANANRDLIVQLCDQAPRRRSELKELTGLNEKKLANYIELLSHRIRIVRFGMGANARWMSVRLFQVLHPNRPVPTMKAEHAGPVVLGVSFGADWTPSQKVEYRDGYKITVWSGPRDRFAPDIKPGQGAISEDWMMRRQGVAVETRVPAYA